MLTTEHDYIISLIRTSLHTTNDALPTPQDVNGVASFVRRNSILPTVYHSLPSGLQELLENDYLIAIHQSVQQDYEGKQALKALSDSGLSCIALKGWELRTLYPESTLRQMADIDILVSPYDFENINNVMKLLNYTSESEYGWKHDSFKKDTVHIEMHKRLTDDSDAIQAWEKGLWDRATVVDGNIYKMSPEDYYIFHFVHLHKDFMNGSLGLRRIVDTWLLQKQPVDLATVKSFLESFGMWNFHEHMVKLSRVTMGDLPMDEDSEVLLNHAFVYGIYGSGKSYKAGRIVAMGESVKKGKFKSKLSAVFLPYKRMKAQFPVLEKWPVLLPFCWLKRIFRFLKGDKKKYSRMLDYSDVSEEDYNEMKRFFEAGGV